VNRRELLQAFGLGAAVPGLPTVKSVEVAQVGPNDVIVLESDDPISMETADKIRASLADIWPGRRIAVFSGGLRMRIAREGESV